VIGAPRGDGRLLAIGIYLSERENNVVGIHRELGRSREWQVEQRWIALGRAPLPPEVAHATAWHQRARRGKFVLLNRLLRDVDLDAYDFVLVCDDDIALPEGFVDRYLALVSRHDLALAQPARTHDSYIDHWLVEQLDGLAARRTRFVEIGPLFSMRRDAARLITPFDEVSPMGWGYDYAWPLVMDGAGLRMGIVDATPVVHSLRKPLDLYDTRDAVIAMHRYLAGRRHLSPHDAFSIGEAYPEAAP
jgi:hypothetical protein